MGRGRPRRGIAESHRATRDVVLLDAIFEAKADLHIGVVTHVLANTGQMLQHRDTEALQGRFRSHAREHEELW